MSDVATLLTAVGGLITALTGSFVLIWNTVRMSRKERPRAARKAIAALVEAAEDGLITPEELAAARDQLEEQEADE